MIDAEAGRELLEKPIRHAVQAAHGHDVITLPEKSQQSATDRRHPGGEDLAGLAALQRSDFLFGQPGGGVPSPGIDVDARGSAERRLRGLEGGEREQRCLVDRRGDCSLPRRRRVPLMSRDRARPVLLGHLNPPVGCPREGSSASRSPSPTSVSVNTIKAIITVGAIPSTGYTCM